MPDYAGPPGVVVAHGDASGDKLCLVSPKSDGALGRRVMFMDHGSHELSPSGIESAIFEADADSLLASTD